MALARKRTVALGVGLLLAVPAVARADHVFHAGEYHGSTAQNRGVTFSADDDGVHAFSTRVKLSCSNGRKKTIRVSVAHLEDLDQTNGRFTYERRTSSKDILRVSGKLADMAGTGTVYRRKGSCKSGKRGWTAVHKH